MGEFDYIIAGGGSAGCVLAGRLSEDSKRTVLLVESGRRDTDPFIHIPAGFLRVAQKGRDVRVYESEPEPHMQGRINAVPQGHVIGGGSSVNAMVYIRGQAQDYDDWERLGCKGWSYGDVLPVFREMERNQRLSNCYHGVVGPLPVSDRDFGHPLCWAFVRAAQEAGHAYREDFNGAQQEGVGFYQTTTHARRRASAAVSFLRNALRRPNVQLMTNTRVAAVTIDNRRATGVRLEDGRIVVARKEVVLAAGALATPKILLLSGIGPADHLSSIGIKLAADLPGVGENYHDHMETTIQCETRDPISIYRQDRGWAAVKNLLQYSLFRTGLLSSTIVEAGGFAGAAGTGRPDVQFHVLAALAGSHDRVPIAAHGITINPCHLRPRSRGTVRLRSSDPRDRILFRANSFAEPEDLAALVRATELGIVIAEQPSLKKLTKQRLLPAPGVESDPHALRDYALANAKTVYHPAGTAKMGSSGDRMAVLDSQLRVRGVRGLRVADASSIPVLISGNTNAPTMMIAERAARFMLADPDQL